MNLLLSLLACYVVFVLVIFTFQRSLLYLPSDLQQSSEVLAREDLGYWPSEENYRGLTSSRQLDDAMGTVIVFHGNAGTAYHRSFYIDALSQLNLRVILAEYPGYGGRRAKPTESTLVADGLETVRRVYQSFGEPVYLWGESLGSGVVAGIAAQSDIPIKGLALLLPWDSLPRLAQTHYWYLPARWLVRDQYNSVVNLQGFDGNIAVLLAGQDAVIPIKHGERLYDSISANKKLWLFDGAGHNSLPVAPDMPWWKEVSDFISN